MKTPHLKLRSIDLSVPGRFYKTRAPKKGETRFISKGRRSLLCDEDIEKPRFKSAKIKVSLPEQKPFQGRENKDGSFSMTRRVNGKFATPIIFDASLMAKLK